MKNERLQGDFVYREFVRRENGLFHAPYVPEIAFYNMVAAGNVAAVRRSCMDPFSDKSGLGVLSDDPVADLRYHFVITAAMLARACIDGGMELPLAYTLSDYYIKAADRLRSIDEISRLHTVMCDDYAVRMLQLRTERIYSKHIVICIDYIYDHLHTRITLETLAAVTGLSCAYLSRLFKKETGEGISDYITGRKLETAMNMLVYSDYPLSFISSTLAFSGQSYFSKLFRERTGLTPMSYRATHRSMPGGSLLNSGQ